MSDFDGAPWALCTGAEDCPEQWHVHGCHADNGQCNDPLDCAQTLVSAAVREAWKLRAPNGTAFSPAEPTCRCCGLPQEVADAADQGLRLSALPSLERHRIAVAIEHHTARCSCCPTIPNPEALAQAISRVVQGIRAEAYDLGHHVATMQHERASEEAALEERAVAARADWLAEEGE